MTSPARCPIGAGDRAAHDEVRAHATAPPVHDAAQDLWIVRRHADVMAVLRDARQFSAGLLGHDSFELRDPDGATLAAEHTLLASDPPVHARLRRALALPHPRLVAPIVKRATASATARITGRGPRDVINELCQPVVAAALAEVLGVPTRVDEVAHWLRICSGCNAQSRPPSLRAAHDALADALWRALFEAPGEAGLVAALRTSVAAGEITALQAVDLCVTVMKGAADTVGHLVGNALCTLQRAPALAATLRAHPDGLDDFLDESTRRDAPVQMTMRHTTAPVVLGGVAIPAGARVLVLLGAANHDPATFDAPGRLVTSRDRRAHVGFGHGAHRCPGAALARMIAHTLVAALLAEDDLHVDLASAVPVEQAAFLGPRHLAIELGSPR